MAQPAREPDARFWRAALQWAAASNGTALLNNIGAAATIPRAHAHLIDERMPFLSTLPERSLKADLIDLPEGCELICKDASFCMLGLRGPIAEQADALLLLADARLTATWNVIIAKDTTWIVPRGKQTAAPYFEEAVGSAEFWGRWCYVDEDKFDRATSSDLEQALTIATVPAIE